MENTKRARKEKSRIRPSVETYVEPKDLLSGLERAREVARRDSQTSGPGPDWDATLCSGPVRASIAPISKSTSLRYIPEVGAQCISSACWDLCGGCRVTGIPTASN